jgi:hypothetical protein
VAQAEIELLLLDPVRPLDGSGQAVREGQIVTGHRAQSDIGRFRCIGHGSFPSRVTLVLGWLRVGPKGRTRAAKTRRHPSAHSGHFRKVWAAVVGVRSAIFHASGRPAAAAYAAVAVGRMRRGCPARSDDRFSCAARVGVKNIKAGAEASVSAAGLAETPARYGRISLGKPGKSGHEAGAPAAGWVPKGPVSAHAFGARLQSARRMPV